MNDFPAVLFFGDVVIFVVAVSVEIVLQYPRLKDKSDANNRSVDESLTKIMITKPMSRKTSTIELITDNQ